MKKSDRRIPCSFDDKDINKAEFWENLFKRNPTIRGTYNKDATEAMFFLNNNPYRASMLTSIDSNRKDHIQVFPVNYNIRDCRELEDIFMNFFDNDDSDIFVRYHFSCDKRQRLTSYDFEYYHTEQ